VRVDFSLPIEDSPALVIIQDGLKTGAVSIEKVFVPFGIKVADSSLWIPCKVQS